MKEIADSVALRKRVQEVFELAALPVRRGLRADGPEMTVIIP